MKKAEHIGQAAFLSSIRQLGRNAKPLDDYDPNVLIISGAAAANDPVAICNRLLADGMVEFAQPNCLRFIEPTGTPADPLFNSQWGFPIMKLPQAWDISAGCASIKIAIIDNGVQLDHPDLIGNLLPGFDATGGGTAGGNKAGEQSHGTNCAGIAAATSNNMGIPGVAYKCKLVPVRAYATAGNDIVSIGGGVSKDQFIVSALNYASANAQIISMSWKLGQTSSPMIDQAVDNALSDIAQKGKVLIGAAGNDGNTSSLLLPCRNPNVLTVGASTSNETRWIGSNKPSSGYKVDLVAPVPNVTSITGGGYSVANTNDDVRTSWSTPGGCRNSCTYMEYQSCTNC